MKSALMTGETVEEFEERNKFSNLLSAFGNAQFDCGAWDESFDTEPYEDVFDRSQKARRAVVEYVEKLRRGQQ